METVTIDSKQFQQLIDSVERLTRMLALTLVKDCQKQNEKIVLLSDFGFGPTDIAKILNTSANTVNNALSRAKKAKGDKLKEPKTNEKAEVGIDE